MIPTPLSSIMQRQHILSHPDKTLEKHSESADLREDSILAPHGIAILKELQNFIRLQLASFLNKVDT